MGIIQGYIMQGFTIGPVICIDSGIPITARSSPLLQMIKIVTFETFFGQNLPYIYIIIEQLQYILTSGYAPISL